jgi:hypothetical protein
MGDTPTDSDIVARDTRLARRSIRRINKILEELELSDKLRAKKNRRLSPRKKAADNNKQ